LNPIKRAPSQVRLSTSIHSARYQSLDAVIAFIERRAGG
jgi:hypothetical protein